MEKLLIVNDISAYGRVSTMASLPIFYEYGIHSYLLPTAIVSNPTDYGSIVKLDTTEFMKDTIDKWHSLGFTFNYICTGLINSSEQVDTILKLISQQKNVFVLVDPIMADNGKIYNDVNKDIVQINKKLVSIADIIVPNLTEAELLTNKFIGEKALRDDEYKTIVENLFELGCKKIVITSCIDSTGLHFNLVAENNNYYKKVYYDNSPTHMVGTGDMFSAFLISEYMKNKDLELSVANSSSYVKKIVMANLDVQDKFDLNIEDIIRNLMK